MCRCGCQPPGTDHGSDRACDTSRIEDFGPVTAGRFARAFSRQCDIAADPQTFLIAARRGRGVEWFNSGTFVARITREFHNDFSRSVPVALRLLMGNYRDSVLHSGFVFPAFLDRRICGRGYRLTLAGGVACRTLHYVPGNGVRALGKEESGPHPDGTACISKTRIASHGDGLF